MLKVCVAGITGWTGKSVALAVERSKVFDLTSGVSKSAAGSDIGTVLGLESKGIKVSPSVARALEKPADVLIDYTHPAIVKDNVMTALEKGVGVVIGTSGLTDDDFKDIQRQAEEYEVGVIAAGNFSLTAALAKRFALIAARYLPQWEIIDYCQGNKVDAPSGTTRELASELSSVRKCEVIVPIEEVIGSKEARGADLAGSRIHSVRLPGFVSSFETIFGLPNERLSIRHDSGSGAEPYVEGTLLAAGKVRELKGLVRGLDRLLFGDFVHLDTG
jgi:4-hydroxy-tetrahydrodipicolinate reductase